MEQFKKAVGDVLETVAALRTLQTLISFHKVEFEQERGGGLDIDSLLEPVTDRLRAAGDVLADREDRIIEALNREGGNPA